MAQSLVDQPAKPEFRHAEAVGKAFNAEALVAVSAIVFHRLPQPLGSSLETASGGAVNPNAAPRIPVSNNVRSNFPFDVDFPLSAHTR